MRKTVSFLLLALLQLALGTFAALILSDPALAIQSDRGGEIFSHNCAACHLDGGNIIIADKNLHWSALSKHHMDSIGAIAHQIKHGKKAMPAFKGRLNEFQIETVASYVLHQAEKGW